MNKEIVQNNKPTNVTALSQVDLGVELDADISQAAFSQWVRVLLQNWRQGTVAVKGRSDVSYSNKKPWKQKGTGRARAGRRSSPVWRGGGVIFGPMSRVRTLSMPQGMKKRVMQAMVYQLLESKRILALDWNITENKPATKQAYHMLKQVGLADKKIVLFVRPEDIVVQASFSNIQNVKILYFDQVNIYDSVSSERWVFLQKDVDHFKAMVSQWS